MRDLSDFLEMIEGPILFDLTTSFHFTGNPTGIARVEERSYEALLNAFGRRVAPVAWNSNTGNYLLLERREFRFGDGIGALNKIEERGDAAHLAAVETLPAGATLLMFGGAWIRNARFIDEIAQIKKATGVKIALLIHDLIQMRLSHLYPAGTGDVFKQNAKRILPLADLLLCYSDTTAADVRAFAKECGCSETPIRNFPIGDMTDRIQASAKPAPWLERQLGKRPYVLFVSSVDVRKNHALLVNVWRRLIQTEADSPDLVLVGRPSWKGEEIIAAIEGEDVLRGHVHILQDASDGDLHWLYQHCLFTAYPSLYEGWGLPVAESLAYGKYCLASNSTSTAEVAPALTELLDPYDFAAWLEAVKKFSFDRNALAEKEERIRQEYVPVPWVDAMKVVLQHIDASDYRAPKPKISLRVSRAPKAASKPEKPRRLPIVTPRRLAIVSAFFFLGIAFGVAISATTMSGYMLAFTAFIAAVIFYSKRKAHMLEVNKASPKPAPQAPPKEPDFIPWEI